MLGGSNKETRSCIQWVKCHCLCSRGGPTGWYTNGTVVQSICIPPWFGRLLPGNWSANHTTGLCLLARHCVKPAGMGDALLGPCIPCSSVIL